MNDPSKENINLPKGQSKVAAQNGQVWVEEFVFNSDLDMLASLSQTFS